MHRRQTVVAVPAFHKNTVSELPPLTLDEPEMYPLEVTLNGFTRHSRQCKALFRRRDLRCQRCVELLRGSLPRGSSWDNYLAKLQGQFQRELF